MSRYPVRSVRCSVRRSAVCYVLSAIIAKRYYTLKTPFLTKILGELAQVARRNQQEFENLPASKELQN